ncbi:glyoxalase superfamily protein [Euzebya sp.]|uniref:glyoxalase superfamily protein n=1 Tax=Euzebya sp. TaxID=1971409 RepID=UPI00351424C4
MDHQLEVVIVPVSDVDRARAFYADALGWHVDVDHQPNESFRIVQLTPPGSACSVVIGVGVSDATPGCYRGTQLMVADIVAARDELVSRGVEVSAVRHMGKDAAGWQDGPSPSRADYESFADFADPDGNTWVLQERGYATAD